jgi:hypothetical protein
MLDVVLVVCFCFYIAELKGRIGRIIVGVLCFFVFYSDCEWNYVHPR